MTVVVWHKPDRLHCRPHRVQIFWGRVLIDLGSPIFVTVLSGKKFIWNSLYRSPKSLPFVSIQGQD